MERREAPGPSQRAPRPGTPPPLKTLLSRSVPLGPGILARGWRTQRQPGEDSQSSPAPPGAPSPFSRGQGKQGHGRSRASENKTRTSGALAEMRFAEGQTGGVIPGRAERREPG